MTIRWRETVRAAELAQFEASLIGRLLIAFGVSSVWLRRVRFANEALFWLGWALVVRRLKLVAGGLAALGLIFALAVTALVVLFAQLA